MLVLLSRTRICLYLTGKQVDIGRPRGGTSREKILLAGLGGDEAETLEYLGKNTGKASRRTVNGSVSLVIPCRVAESTKI